MSIETELLEPDYDTIIPYEEDYDTIKNEPNEMWYKYEANILKFCSITANRYNWDKDDLLSIAYIKFLDCCKKYNPYYEGKFFPFRNYMFNMVILTLKAYCQRGHFKLKRETPTEETKLKTSDTSINTRQKSDIDFKLDFKEAINCLSEPKRSIILLALDGYTQVEIAQMYDLSQPRVWQIINNFSKRLVDIMQGNTNKAIPEFVNAYKILAPYIENLDYNNKLFKKKQSKISIPQDMADDIMGGITVDEFCKKYNRSASMHQRYKRILKERAMDS